jgi:hypothetical protein
MQKDSIKALIMTATILLQELIQWWQNRKEPSVDEKG